MRAFRLLSFALLCSVLASVASWAGTTGKIAGIVRDSRTQEGLPGVNVVVQGTSLGASTDIEGRYVILNVPPGRYSIVASLVGYRRFEINDLLIQVDFTTPLNIALEEGSVELDAVVVQAERTPLIRQDLTNTVASISSESIEALPVTEISQVIGLQAGIVVDDDGSIHIRGGLGNEVAYTVNGMNVNNPYGNQRSVGIATNAVEEVSVSSGTFNAEYGQALSGVVNYVTKEGGRQLTGSVRYYTGDYLTDEKDLFFNIGNFGPWNVNRTELSIGGPVFSDVLSFFASGVYNWNGGYLGGERLYLPQDSYLSRESFPTGDPRRSSSTDPYYFGPLVYDTSNAVGGASGDGSIARLNWSRSYNLQANASLRIIPEIKLRYEFITDFSEVPNGASRSYRFLPDGRSTSTGESYFHSLDFTHTVSEKAFYTVKGSYIVDIGKSFMFDDPYDARYLPSFYLQTFPNTVYLTGGNDPYRFYRKTTTLAAKADVVSQPWPDHEIKAGVEIRSHELEVESYTLLFEDPNNPSATPSFNNALRGSVFLPKIPTVEGGYTYYTRSPLQMGGYIQDKIELFNSIILNLGFRYDYFDPDAQYNPTLSAELTDQDTIFAQKGLVNASVKHMPQPRISVSYPITDRGTIRFSYGHFYQIGSLATLYQNPNFRAPLGTVPSFGNPDVEPQRSIQYELGLQQGLTEDLRLEVTAYYKDVRNYIYPQQVITSRGDKRYYVLSNLAYANTRGVILSILKRRSIDGVFAASLDYTFQVAEGSRTEPAEEIYFNEEQGRLNESWLVPQSFDRSHTLTGTLQLTQPRDWLVSLIGYLRTGTPYTPQFSSNIVPISFEQNSDRQPVQWNIDLRLEKWFPFGPFDLSVFLQVDNLFDIRNELYVYANSGRALYNIEETTNPSLFNDLRRRIERQDPSMIPMSAVDNYYANPGNLSAPRLVRFGASLTF